MALPTYEDLLYEKDTGVVTITINRPDTLNALRGRTFGELADALAHAAADREAGVVVLTGAGERAFSSGGDVSERAEKGSYGGRSLGLGIDMMKVIHTMPKAVIARVRGYAIGFGNILAFNCDLTISGESGIFGQNGPRVGSFDPGWGTTYLARLVGQKKARELWFLCRRYPAREALAMGLINAVVPDAQLDAEVRKWADEILALSPTSIAGVKASLSPDLDHIYGIQQMGLQTLSYLYASEEAREGAQAFTERRKPDFARFR